jgi:transglycosylase-like protein with SLT domain
MAQETGGNNPMRIPSYLKVFTTLSCLVISTVPTEAATRIEIKRMVIEEARQSNVPVSLALAVAKVESDFNEKALSSAGARGVMQIMPATGRHEFGLQPNQLWNPELNIRTGIRFLEKLHSQYGQRWDLALSHYNGGTLKGTGRHAKPHKRTQKYVNTVFRWKNVYSEQAFLWDKPEVEAVPLKIATLDPTAEDDERAEAIRTLREETRRRAEEYYVQKIDETPRDLIGEYNNEEAVETPRNLFLEYQDEEELGVDEDRFFEEVESNGESGIVSTEAQTSVFVERWNSQNARIITRSNPPTEYVQRQSDYLFTWKPWRSQKFRNRPFVQRKRPRRRFH